MYLHRGHHLVTSFRFCVTNIRFSRTLRGARVTTSGLQVTGFYVTTVVLLYYAYYDFIILAAATFYSPRDDAEKIVLFY